MPAKRKISEAAVEPEVVPRLIAHDPRDIRVGKADVIMAYRQVFGTREGAIVLADLMRHFGFTLQTMYDKSAKNPMEDLAHNEGSRRVLVHIGIRMETDPASVEATEKQEL